MTTTTTIDKRAQILAALDAFARQRPGLEFGNYGDIRTYRAEMRAITRDLHDVRALLAAVAWRSSITAEDLRAGFRAYSGRLTLTERENGSVALDYCTCQYFPTEYRKAVCAVLGTVLFAYFRECVQGTGKDIRAYARKELGARLQRRWVD